MRVTGCWEITHFPTPLCPLISTRVMGYDISEFGGINIQLVKPYMVIVSLYMFLLDL